MRSVSIRGLLLCGALISALTAPAIAQQAPSYSALRIKKKQIFIKVIGGVKSSSFKIVPVSPRDNFAPDEATLVVQRIVSAMGLASDFALDAVDGFGGASAGMTEDSIRVIVYDPAFIDNLNRGGESWAATSIFAHEIGHHARRHDLLSETSRARMELEADEFSGAVMAKLGASLTDAQSIVRMLAPEAGDANNPGRAARLAAIARGYANPRSGAPVRAASAFAPPATPAVGLDGPLQAIDRFVNALRQHQPNVVREMLSPGAQILLIAHRTTGLRDTTRYTIEDMANSALSNTTYDERTIDRTGEVRGNDAVVLHNYNYYEAGALDHCGIERYALRKEPAGWRIVAVEDHQVKESCPSKP